MAAVKERVAPVRYDRWKDESLCRKDQFLEGKSVITVEGLSEREKEVYSYCFEAGAVQCGFCILDGYFSERA